MAWNGADTVRSGGTTDFPGLAMARINAIGDGGVLATGHPLQADALKNTEMKKFSGNVEDWEDFKQSWELYLMVAHGGSSAALNDTQVLSALLGRLDPGSKAMLVTELKKNRGLRYNDFGTS